MSEQARIFVCHHASEDEDRFTARLVKDLETLGIAIQANSTPDAAEDFVAGFSEGSPGQQWFVFILTPAAVASPWMRRQVNAAISTIRTEGLLPLMMQPCPEQEIPLTWRFLQRMQGYDATDDYEGARERLLATLRAALAAESPAGQAVPGAPPSRTPRLPVTPWTRLGYRVEFLHGAEAILPPLCTVPSGSFLMGSDPYKDTYAQYDEEPQHGVMLSAFEIAAHPVTVAEYACFVRATGRTAPTGNDTNPYSVSWQKQVSGRLEHPVVMVSWFDAVAYAAWLAECTGEPWRLPSEAEWEKAARWDAATGRERIYPWGDTFDADRCNTYESNKGTTTPVGSYPDGASPCGAQDMTGNVWEWTSSPFTSYSDDDDEPTEAAAETRVLRGCFWGGVGTYGRVASRFHIDPDHVINSHGFRIARALTGE